MSREVVGKLLVKPVQVDGCNTVRSELDGSVHSFVEDVKKPSEEGLWICLWTDYFCFTSASVSSPSCSLVGFFSIALASFQRKLPFAALSVGLVSHWSTGLPAL